MKISQQGRVLRGILKASVYPRFVLCGWDSSRAVSRKEIRENVITIGLCTSRSSPSQINELTYMAEISYLPIQSIRHKTFSFLFHIEKWCVALPLLCRERAQHLFVRRKLLAPYNIDRDSIEAQHIERISSLGLESSTFAFMPGLSVLSLQVLWVNLGFMLRQYLSFFEIKLTLPMVEPACAPILTGFILTFSSFPWGHCLVELSLPLPQNTIVPIPIRCKKGYEVRLFHCCMLFIPILITLRTSQGVRA